MRGTSRRSQETRADEAAKNRRIGSDHESGRERDDEQPDGGAAQHDQRQQHQERGERGIERAGQALIGAEVDGLLEARALRVGEAKVTLTVLANAVEHDDRVVHREADDREDCRDKQGVHLNSDDVAQQGEESQQEQGVVQKGSYGGEAQYDRSFHAAEGPHDVEENEHRRPPRPR